MLESQCRQPVSEKCDVQFAFLIRTSASPSQKKARVRTFPLSIVWPSILGLFGGSRETETAKKRRAKEKLRFCERRIVICVHDSIWFLQIRERAFLMLSKIWRRIEVFRIVESGCCRYLGSPCMETEWTVPEAYFRWQISRDSVPSAADQDPHRNSAPTKTQRHRPR